MKIFLGGNHRVDWVSTYPFPALPGFFPEAAEITGHPSTKGDVVIGNDVWIGYAAIILSGVTIGDGAVIGAGSVVSKNVGPYEIWAGNPAVCIKKRFPEEIIARLLTEKWWDKPDAAMRASIKTLCESPLKDKNG
ncbi:CatB-related O-acetyltransferase [Rurimicrobium arvi]|uniref:CatB-related O-acetyltransferase n=1 Tax=Rurimicrobium arvi TaxID=2049916 RepID=UPI0031E18952